MGRMLFFFRNFHRRGDEGKSGRIRDSTAIRFLQFYGKNAFFFRNLHSGEEEGKSRRNRDSTTISFLQF